MYLVSNATAASPQIAAAVWAALGVASVLIGSGLRQQWRGFGVRPWLVVFAIALVIGGAALAWTINGWLGEAGLVYGGFDARPAEPVPSSIIGSWPLVQAGARVAMGLGAIALFLMLNTAVIRQRRTARKHETSLR